MKANIFYDYDWAIDNIFENEGILYTRTIEYIFYFMAGYDICTKVFCDRIPERIFLNKFWKWLMDNYSDYKPDSAYWYDYYIDKAQNTSISEYMIFHNDYLKFNKSDNKYNQTINYDCDAYILFQNTRINKIYAINRKHVLLMKERKVSFLFYIFLGDSIFLEKNCNVPIESNIAFKFGKWLNKKYPEYDENKIGLFWYLIIEDLAKKNNKDELNLLAELFTEFLQVSENRNVVFDEETKKLYEYNGDGSIKKEF